MTIGQILVTPLAARGSELRHRDDAGTFAEQLTTYTDPDDAITLALYDDSGAYRPLKGAPNLRRGWRLIVRDDDALELALDRFYPARLGAWRAHRAGRLAVTSLRETLARQTGMYRVTQKLTDQQADKLVGRFCRSDSGCLRTILWKLDSSDASATSDLPPQKYETGWDQFTTTPAAAGHVPLLCQEACNLLVAEARAVVKGERAVEPAA